MTPRTGVPCLSLALVTILVWLLASPLRVFAADRPSGPLHKTRSAVIARNGMAATSQPLATAAAIRILQDGGNCLLYTSDAADE